MYRKPREGHPYAYPLADTLADIIEGRKRARKVETVLVPMSEAGHLVCPLCEIALADPYPLNPGESKMVTDDTFARVRHNPRTGEIVGTHYYCGWGALMADIFALGRRMREAEIA